MICIYRLIITIRHISSIIIGHTNSVTIKCIIQIIRFRHVCFITITTFTTCVWQISR